MVLFLVGGSSSQFLSGSRTMRDNLGNFKENMSKDITLEQGKPAARHSLVESLMGSRRIQRPPPRCMLLITRAGIPSLETTPKHLAADMWRSSCCSAQDFRQYWVGGWQLARN